MIIDSVILNPYDIKFYVISTETKDEDKNAESLINKEARTIGIGESFTDADVRAWDSAFDYGSKDHHLVAAIYIHRKRISLLSLMHELIHCLNWINSHFNICSEYGKDEAVACFFEYLVDTVMKLLNRNCIKVTKQKLSKRKPICKLQQSTPN